MSSLSQPSPTSGYTGWWCPACDQVSIPSPCLKHMSDRREGMLVKCASCQRVYSVNQLKQLKARMDQPHLVEKQPPHTQVYQVWIYPEVLSALQQKFPQNLQTTLCSLLTAVGDPDTVVIEGEHAREMAQLGIKRGKDVLGLAKEVTRLRKELDDARVREKVLEPILRALGGIGGAVSQAPPEEPVTQAPPPPHARFANLAEDPSGMLVPATGSDDTYQQRASQFVMPGQGGGQVGSGQQPQPQQPAGADGRPGFMSGLVR